METYQDCEFRYFLQYICKIRSPGSASTVSGNIVHKVLEILAWQNKRNKLHVHTIRNDPYRLLDIVFKHYQRKEPTVVLDKTSYNLCKKCLDWTLKSPFNPLKIRKILGIEQNFFIEINKKGFAHGYNDVANPNLAINGFIDLIHEVDKDTIEVVDYKTGKYKTDWATGKNKETEDDFRKDLQLRMYYYACKEMYPQYKNIVLTIVYLTLKESYTVSMDESDVEGFIHTLRQAFNSIKDNESPSRLIDDKSRSHLNFKCHRVCHFGKTRDANNHSLCKKMWKMHNEGIPPDTIKLTYEGKMI